MMVRPRPITIVVDTTATFDDVMFSRTRWIQLLSLCARGQVRIAIPVVVLRETTRHWEKQAKAALSAAHDRRDRAVKGRKVFGDLGLGDLGEPPPVPEVVIDRNAFYQDLIERLTSLGVEVLPIPDVAVPEILERDLERKKPFSDTGKGFRDVLIWHSVKALLGRLSKDDKVHFVTNNTSDYCQDGDLHPELVAELDSLEAALHHVTTLSQLLEVKALAHLVAGLTATQDELEAFLQAASQVTAAGTSEPRIRDLIAEALQHGARELVSEEIASGLEDGIGLDFSEIPIPQEIDSPTIIDVEPDSETVDWDAYETYEEGTLLVRASIDAIVEIQGFVYKADYYGMDDEVTVIEFDWNDHMALVQTSVEARLVFQLRVEEGAGYVEHTEFEMAESLWLPTADLKNVWERLANDLLTAETD